MDDESDIISRIEQEPGLNTYERAVIILLRRLHERVSDTDAKLAEHIKAEDGLIDAWRNARGAAKVLSMVVAALSVLGGAIVWLKQNLHIVWK